MALVPIPLLIAVEMLARRDDGSRQFWLRVGVMGADAPLTATIEKPFRLPAKVLEVENSGGIFLPGGLEDVFVLKCLEAVYVVLEYSDIGELPLPDATDWIKAIFLPRDAEVVLEDLRKQVKALDFRPMQSTAFMPVRSPRKRGWHYVA